MWQGCVVGFTGNSCSSGSADEMFWQDALEYCEGLSWGNDIVYEDWVLPDRWQIQSIFEYGSSTPIDSGLFPASGSLTLWTSATHIVDSDSAWRFNPSTGQYDLKAKDNSFSGAYVRCVRRVDAAIDYVSRFTMDEEIVKTVTDHVTGLKWQRCQSGYEDPNCADSSGPYVMDRTEAGTYCSTLDWGIYQSGWRLPTIKELNSLAIDRQSPYIDQAMFYYTVFNPHIWSSNEDIFGNHYYLSFDEGTINETITENDTLAVRCVHDP